MGVYSHSFLLSLVNDQCEANGSMAKPVGTKTKTSGNFTWQLLWWFDQSSGGEGHPCYPTDRSCEQLTASIGFAFEFDYKFLNCNCGHHPLFDNCLQVCGSFSNEFDGGITMSKLYIVWLVKRFPNKILLQLLMDDCGCVFCFSSNEQNLLFMNDLES